MPSYGIYGIVYAPDWTLEEQNDGRRRVVIGICRRVRRSGSGSCLPVVHPVSPVPCPAQTALPRPAHVTASPALDDNGNDAVGHQEDRTARELGRGHLSTPWWVHGWVRARGAEAAHARPALAFPA
jgi:hypothetical protein